VNCSDYVNAILQRGYGVVTMTVLSRAKEFGFDFEILRAKKSPTDFSAGLKKNQASVGYCRYPL
jgi:hypothetical protein